MLQLPESLNIERSLKSEAALLKRGKDWLAQDERKGGLHASDLMDPRQAYFKHTDPRPIQDRLVNVFLVGKIGHIIVLSTVDKAEGLNVTSDEGSEWSEELGIWYSADKTLAGIPRELKTTRSFFDAKTVKDLELYCEQLMIYMVARNSTVGQLWVLYLNLKDADGKTAPSWRAFTVTVSEADLAKYKAQLIKTRKALTKAIDTKDPEGLPLCRKFKCGAKNCEYWDQCKPEGRYGLSERKWKE
jgi:hypothetical protein